MMSVLRETVIVRAKDMTVRHAEVWMPTNGKTDTIGMVLPQEVATGTTRKWLLPSRVEQDSISSVRMAELPNVETVATVAITLASNCKK